MNAIGSFIIERAKEIDHNRAYRLRTLSKRARK